MVYFLQIRGSCALLASREGDSRCVLVHNSGGPRCNYCKHPWFSCLFVITGWCSEFVLRRPNLGMVSLDVQA